MTEAGPRPNRVRVAVPIRVRGMSAENKYFDEQTETSLVSGQDLITRIQSMVELDTEVHVTNLKNNAGGTFRVTWVNQTCKDGRRDLGLELIDSEGALWDVQMSSDQPQAEAVVPPAWLECKRCHQQILAPVPEAELEFLYEGFTAARHCNNCKATTAWKYTATPGPANEEVLEAIPVSEGEEASGAAPGASSARKADEDRRRKGRAPLKMSIKLTRQKYGTTFEEVCETVNVSRTGALFLTGQNYDIGEIVKVILPYREGEPAIPVTGRVVRKTPVAGSFYHGIGIHIEQK